MNPQGKMAIIWVTSDEPTDMEIILKLYCFPQLSGFSYVFCVDLEVKMRQEKDLVDI